MGNRVADQFGFEFLQRPHFALGIEQRQRLDGAAGGMTRERSGRLVLKTVCGTRASSLSSSGAMANSAAVTAAVSFASSESCAAICGNSSTPDAVAFGEHHGAEHRVFKLADIAGPVKGGEHAHRLGRDDADALALLGGKARQEMPGQRRNIGGRSRSGGTVIGKTCSR